MAISSDSYINDLWWHQTTDSTGTAIGPGGTILIQPTPIQQPILPKAGSVEYFVHLISANMHQINHELFEAEMDKFVCERYGHEVEGKTCSRCKQPVAKLVKKEITAK